MINQEKVNENIIEENLYFNFEDNTTKVPFKINLMSVLDCLIYQFYSV